MATGQKRWPQSSFAVQESRAKGRWLDNWSLGRIFSTMVNDYSWYVFSNEHNKSLPSWSYVSGGGRKIDNNKETHNYIKLATRCCHSDIMWTFCIQHIQNDIISSPPFPHLFLCFSSLFLYCKKCHIQDRILWLIPCNCPVLKLRRVLFFSSQTVLRSPPSLQSLPRPMAFISLLDCYFTLLTRVSDFILPV